MTFIDFYRMLCPKLQVTDGKNVQVNNEFMWMTHTRTYFMTKILENRDWTEAEGQGPNWWNKYFDARQNTKILQPLWKTRVLKYCY